MNSADLAQRAAAGDFSPEVAAWLVRGIRAHLQGEPLEQALGLCHASRLMARNHHLVAAAEIIDAGRGLGTWQLACELSNLIKRRKSRGSSGDAAVDQSLRAAEATGAWPLSSERRLYDVLTNAR